VGRLAQGQRTSLTSKGVTHSGQESIHCLGRFPGRAFCADPAKQKRLTD